VCEVQFFAWIGWFPFLFYTTTYIAEIYAEPYFAAQPEMTPEQIEYFWQQGTRAGTFALFMFAIVTFATSVLLPFAVAKSKASGSGRPGLLLDEERMSQASTPTAHALAATTITSAGGYFAHHPVAEAGAPVVSRKRTLMSVRNFLRNPSCEFPWLTLRRTWLLSHLVFAILMWSTFFVRNVLGATLLVSLIGIPWAVTQWAPFALIAAEIRKRDSVRHSVDTSGEASGTGDMTPSAEQAGVVLGLHNVAIAAPQVLATLLSSVVFSALQKPRGSVGDDSVAWVLRLGGLCALVAAWLTRRVQDGS